MTTSTLARPRKPGRLWLALGLGAPILAIAVLAMQLWAHRLVAPWYLPCSATLGATFLVASLRQARTVWRVLALLLVSLLAAGEWALLFTTRLPAYTGPIAVGQPFPAFASARADGVSFTERDLTSDQNSVLVVFRGRW